MKSGTVCVERLFDASAEVLWKALTEPEFMKQWYFDLPGFKAIVGYQFQFYGGTPEHQYLHLCEVTEVITGKKLSYTWRYDGYSGNSIVSFELFPQDKKTLLKLTHTGIDTFPADNPDLAITNFEAGWNEIITSSLYNYLLKIN